MRRTDFRPRPCRTLLAVPNAPIPIRQLKANGLILSTTSERSCKVSISSPVSHLQELHRVEPKELLRSQQQLLAKRVQLALNRLLQRSTLLKTRVMSTLVQRRSILVPEFTTLGLIKSLTLPLPARSTTAALNSVPRLPLMQPMLRNPTLPLRLRSLAQHSGNTMLRILRPQLGCSQTKERHLLVSRK